MLSIIPYTQSRRNDMLRFNNNFGGMYNMFDDFFNNGLAKSQSLYRDAFKIDIIENDNEYVLEAELPGILKDEIKINVDNDSLVISVEKTEENNSEDKNFVHKERYVSSMKRRIRLGDIKNEEITAKLDNGVLSIVLPKDSSANQVRNISIA